MRKLLVVKVVSMLLVILTVAASSLFTGVCSEGKQTIDYSHRIAAGNGYYMAILEDNTLWGWGKDDGTHLGLYYTNDSVAFVDKPRRIMDNVQTVYAGNENTLVVKMDKTLWGWGKCMPSTGESRLTYSLKPIKLMDNVSSAAAGGGVNLVIKTDGSLWGWGFVAQGLSMPTELNTKPIYTPLKLMDGIKKAAIYNSGVYLLKNDGTLLSTVGDTMTYGNMVPVKTTLGTLYCYKVAQDIKEFIPTFAPNSIYYIKTDDTLWGVGYVACSNLGKGNAVSCSKPIKIADNIVSATVGSFMPEMALKKDGTVIAWGPVMGFNTIKGEYDSAIEEMSPAFTLMNGIRAISADTLKVIAAKNDGTFIYWGFDKNSSGWEYDDENIAYPPEQLVFSKDVPALFPSSIVQKSKLFSYYIKEAEASGKLEPYDKNYKADWSGIWEDKGVVSAIGLKFTQSGMSVSGKHNEGDAPVQMKATIDGNRLHGYWYQGFQSFAFEISMSKDEQSYKGLIYYEGDADPISWIGGKPRNTMSESFPKEIITLIPGAKIIRVNENASEGLYQIIISTDKSNKEICSFYKTALNDTVIIMEEEELMISGLKDSYSYNIMRSEKNVVEIELIKTPLDLVPVIKDGMIGNSYSYSPLADGGYRVSYQTKNDAAYIISFYENVLTGTENYEKEVTPGFACLKGKKSGYNVEITITDDDISRGVLIDINPAK